MTKREKSHTPTSFTMEKYPVLPMEFIMAFT